MYRALCTLVASVLFLGPLVQVRGAGAVPPGKVQSEAKPSLKERILEVPPKTMIEVRLLNKQKLRGRLGEVTDEGFSLQIAQASAQNADTFVYQNVCRFVLRNSHKKNGAPNRAVITPNGTSCGAMMVRARMSASSSNAAPAMMANGISRR